jgi:hypothetical protein
MISIAQETLVYRRAGFSPALSLLIPTFAFPTAPASIARRIHRSWNAPLPDICPPSFGSVLDARLLSTPCRSTSELLRTL